MLTKKDGIEVMKIDLPTAVRDECLKYNLHFWRQYIQLNAGCEGLTRQETDVTGDALRACLSQPPGSICLTTV